MKIALLVLLGIFVLVMLVAGGFVLRNTAFASWYAWRVRRAGLVEREVQINGSKVHYAEGPKNGPPLLLIHGQVTDWRNWSPVLPRLARHFHIFAVDCYGHGKSARVPEKYTANAFVADMNEFIDKVIGAPAVVAGHSSGGLIAAGLAAHAPEALLGVVLEDPPFFSSVHPRATSTWNYVDLSVPAHGFLQSGETDFTMYYLRHGALWDLFKEAKGKVQGAAIRYRERHTGKPVKLWFMPPSVNDLFRSMESYDPRFAEAFYDNSFHDDFDHAEVLARIAVPAVLIHTNWRYDENGILQAAMDAEEAERARSLIPDVVFYKVDSGHGFHFEKPREFIRIVLELKERLDLGGSRAVPQAHRS